MLIKHFDLHWEISYEMFWFDLENAFIDGEMVAKINERWDS